MTLYFSNTTSPTLKKYDYKVRLTFNDTVANESFPTVHYFVKSSLVGNKSFVGIFIDVNGNGVSANFTLISEEIGCYYWDNSNEVWTTKGCMVSTGTADER